MKAGARASEIIRLNMNEMSCLGRSMSIGCFNSGVGENGMTSPLTTACYSDS